MPQKLLPHSENNLLSKCFQVDIRSALPYYIYMLVVMLAISSQWESPTEMHYKQKLHTFLAMNIIFKSHCIHMFTLTP